MEGLKREANALNKEIGNLRKVGDPPFALTFHSKALPVNDTSFFKCISRRVTHQSI